MSDREMDFFEHLDELRTRLIRAIISIAIGMAVAWHYSAPILQLILEPIREAMPQSAKVIYTHVLEPFTIQIQIALVAGLVLAAPLVLWEIWAFVAPGLLPHERRYVLYAFPASLLLFFAGVATAFFALPFAFRFLLQFMPPDTDLYQSVKVYLFFLLRMLLAFGLVYQAPLVLMFLSLLEIVSLEFLVAKWRHAVFTCFLVSAIVTPTWDPLNMTLLAAPLIVLYILSLFLVWGVEFFRRRRREQEEPELRAVVDAAVRDSSLQALSPPESLNPVEANSVSLMRDNQDEESTPS